MDTSAGKEVLSASISAHCARHWPYADQTPGMLGYHIADAIEAICGASALALLLQNDQYLRDARDVDEPDDEIAPFDAHTRSGLLSALHTCLDAAGDGIHRVYGVARGELQDARHDT